MATHLNNRAVPADEDAIVAVLVSELGAEPSPEDRAAWLLMSPAQREKALQRISILTQWNNERGDLTLEKAADRAKVSAKRFYEMASAWRRRRDLAALGVFSKAQDRSSRLDARAVNLLQSLVPKVVEADPDRSIESMRASLIAQVDQVSAATIPPIKPSLRIPSRMVVRRMIERELARRAAESLICHDVAFDHCPLSLIDEARVRFTLFAIVDRATGLLLGVSVGQLPDSAAGYAGAAKDALDRILRLNEFGDWADATQRIELSAGPEAGTAAVAAAIVAVPGAPDLNLATGGAAGRYLRAALGDRLGRAEFRAKISLTKGQPMGESHVYSLAAARLEILHGTEAHNAGLASAPGKPPDPPENLITVLKGVAALDPRHDR